MCEIEFLTDRVGRVKAVVLPIALWKQLLPHEETTLAELAEAMEDYCLNKAMEEARTSRSLTREEALAFL